MLQLSKFKSDPLDSCEKSLINTRNTGTVGDYLCGQVRRWLKRDDAFKKEGKDNIKITFEYSSCGEDWTPVNEAGNKLYTDEDLCCTPDGRFRRCNGEAYATECPGEK